MPTAAAAALSVDALRDRLAAIGQDHLLRFWDELSPESRRSLHEQIASLDLDGIPGLVRDYVLSRPPVHVHDDVAPAPYYPANPEAGGHGHALRYDRNACRAAGEALLRAGKVAAFTVAGGQGSRLGFEGPKGCFPAGAVTGKPLFQVFAEQVLAASRRYGAGVPWYIMTSPLNHEPTVAFFRDRGFFGLDQRNVMFFAQGVMPSFDLATGRILLASRDQVATNPDGHGGSIRALEVSGAVADMRRRGVEQVSYFQVDNPIVRALDPVFLGLHAGAGGAASSAEMSSKMIPKAHPEEKLGVFCRAGGRLHVVEYSDLPERLARERNPDGSLRFVAGSIAVHVISVDFIHRLNTSADLRLPYHRAEKKVPHVDPITGVLVRPAHNNAVKLERFVFDALPLCRAPIVYETDRVEEFAPIKNADGADSPETCRRIQTRRAARWLEAAGVHVPRDPSGEPDCTLEISPLTALEPADLRGRDLPAEIERGARIAL
jgi:UDP-N-acetylglucosamine/UDP-N-acetylgalactosamine diphosphorylase